MNSLSLKEFEEKAGELYDELPENIRNKFSLHVAEFNPSDMNAFGYWTNMFPNAICLVYETFLANGDFSDDHIRRVIKHEVEHVLMGLKHSEHKHD